MASAIQPSTALNATAQQAEAWWLEVSCSCGQLVFLPIRLMIERQPQLAGATLGAIARRMRCEKCGAKPPAYVGLNDDPARRWAGPGHRPAGTGGISLMGAFAGGKTAGLQGLKREQK